MKNNSNTYWWYEWYYLLPQNSWWKSAWNIFQLLIYEMRFIKTIISLNIIAKFV